MAIDKESKGYVLGTAFVLCLVCSVFVSAAAIGLRPAQQQAKSDDKRKNILRVVGLWQPGVNIDEAFKQITPKVVDLASGEFVEGIDAAGYDQYKAAREPGHGVALTTEEDIASIKFKPRHATVYFVYNPDGSVKNVILPISGYGLWSTLYGFLALEANGNTVVGINFYQHGETPGLGGEVDNPKWKGLWPGKKVYDENGRVALRLVKGGVDPSAPGAAFKVDALAGATLTSNGVSNTVQYWLSDAGFKPFLSKLAAARNKPAATEGES
ncbi:MAG: Na(+)-translocating NADH-quinone reductase subunit C [Gammaproteobacteria bacterium]|nr:Na(+)-translocating NADH-quinone reductase subunit C [Gammaproteobacteria bacterium]